MAGTEDLLVTTDEYMLEIIIRNLLSNAIKFTPQGGSVRLSASRSVDGSEILVSVADNGIGIEEEGLANLFTLQTRMKSEGTSGEKGSGLGLMFCQDIAKRLGARIDVRTALGQGSEFTVILPVPKPV